MRQVLALFIAAVFTLSLAGVAVAQGQTGTGSSGTPSTELPKSSTPGADTGKSATGTTGKSGAKTAAGTMRGQHRMMGEVTKIDSTKGTVTLKTEEGDLDLHFPPSALQGIKEGDRVEVQMAIRPAAGAGAKSGASHEPSSKAPASKAGKSSTGTSGTAAKPGEQPKTQ